MPPPDKERLLALVNAALRDLLADTGQPPAAPGARVFGGEGALLDSMGLVNLIADLEARLEAELGLALVLADERAMSRSSSPFRTVSTIADHIAALAAAAPP